MGLWNLGSLATHTLSIVDNIPAGVSGALITIAHQQVLYAETFTGNTIGSVNIAENYQPALTDLMLSAVLPIMNMQGADVNSVSLGDFSESKGGESNSMSSASLFKKSAEEKLTALGRRVDWYKAWG